MPSKAWIAKAAKQSMVLETVDLGPLGAEDVEVAVEHCGLCHSDLSAWNNDWGISQYPAILGHEVVGRVTALGSNAKGLRVGQSVGVGWNSGSCMHCHQCMSGSHHLCPQVQPTIFGHRGGFASHIRSHWAWAVPLPEKLNFADAGPLLCGGITVFAPLAMYARPTDRVGIIGIGGLGHMAVKFAARLRVRRDGVHVEREQVRRSQRVRGESRRIEQGLGNDQETGRQLRPTDQHRQRETRLGCDDRFARAQRPVARCRCRAGTDTGRGILAHRTAAQRLGFAHWLPRGDRDMLDFAARHNVAPQTEHFPMSRINDAFARLESGKARYRIVLDADF